MPGGWMAALVSMQCILWYRRVYKDQTSAKTFAGWQSTLSFSGRDQVVWWTHGLSADVLQLVTGHTQILHSECKSKATCNREVTLENIFLGEVLTLLWSCFLQGSLGHEGEERTDSKKQQWTETVLANEGNNQVELWDPTACLYRLLNYVAWITRWQSALCVILCLPEKLEQPLHKAKQGVC
jgi:hypothetical protein